MLMSLSEALPSPLCFPRFTGSTNSDLWKKEEFFYHHFYSELARNVPILNYQKVARLFLRMKDDSMRFEGSCKQKNSYSTKMKCYSYYKISK